MQRKSAQICRDDGVKDTARKAMKGNALRESADYQGIDAGSTYQ
ncbi:hypothetical protein N175_17990 [Vibrio anguillarum M3]|nr:hypothetical protein N175_17990 [Vibrio anguillarum M3]